MMDEIKLVKYLSGELEKNEVEEVELWLLLPENKEEFEKIKQLWEASPTLENTKLFNADRSWEGFKARMNTSLQPQSKPITRVIPILRYAMAASLAIIIGLAGYFYFLGKNNSQIIQYSAGNLKQEHPVILPDGTQVFLNRNTHLSFQKDFNKQIRMVTLSGEAYFNVAKNPKKPFIIRTSSTQIKVVGTSFNVLAYSFSDSVRVSVESGIVEMYSNTDQNSKIRLLVGNEGTYVKSNKRLSFEKSFDTNMIAWKTNRLNFKNADMEYVSNALQHAFGQKILLPAEKLKKCRLTVNFNNQSLETVLSVIQETLGISYTNQNGIYILSGPGC
jgi:transmembrane sensor